MSAGPEVTLRKLSGTTSDHFRKALLNEVLLRRGYRDIYLPMTLNLMCTGMCLGDSICTVHEPTVHYNTSHVKTAINTLNLNLTM